MTPEQRTAALILADYFYSTFGARWTQCQEAADLLRELASEPHGEPVAWQLPGTDSFLTAAAKAHHSARAAAYTIPLYANPPQRQPLTDEQIDAIPFDGFTHQSVRPWSEAE